jgi:valyl-tRNA synthetase
MLERLAGLLRDTTSSFERYDYTSALRSTEDFFWWFCDDHIEHVKRRRATGDDDAASATSSCLTALSVLLRLFAPFVPFVTEEIWSWWRTGTVHRASWPDAVEVRAALGGAADAGALIALEQASAVTAVIRRERSLRKFPFGVPVRALQLPESVRADWPRISGDVLAGNNAGQAEITFAADFAVEFAAPAAS